MALAMVRISEVLKRQAKAAAAGSGMSLAAWLDVAILEKLRVTPAPSFGSRCGGCHEAILAGEFCESCAANVQRVIAEDLLAGIRATQS